MENKVITKIEFDIDIKNTEKVSDLKLNIKVNDNYVTDYTYESFNIYKYDDAIESVCNMDKTTKLSNDYVLKDDEEYVIAVEELKIKEMEYSAIIWQSVGTTFINGKDVSEYSNYCMGSKYESGNSQGFRFVLSKNIEKGNITTTTVQNTIEPKNNNNIFIPFAILGVIILIGIICVVLYKNKK